MKRVLFISYYVPPAGGGGVQRSSKFIKYLPTLDWQPIVLTVSENAYQIRDESLLNDIQPGTPIFRTASLHLYQRLPWRIRNFISRWFLLIDEQVGWLPGAVSQGERIIQHFAIDAIYSTSPPNTAHLIAYKLKMLSNIPWLADFRDPWIGNFSANFPTSWHKKVVERWEAKVINLADCILSVSPPIEAALKSRYPHASPSKFFVVPNGYDSNDFDQSITQSSIENIQSKNNTLNVVYSGSFYGTQQTPLYFLHGLKLALVNLANPKIQVRMIGNINPDVSRQISKLGLSHIVQVTGYIPHRQSIEEINKADLLLLIIGSGASMEGVVTGKIYEYLAAKKPILALVPEGVAAELIHSARAGIVVPPTDISAINRAIVDLYNRWRNDDLRIESNREVIEHYERHSLTARLTDIMNKMSTQG